MARYTPKEAKVNALLPVDIRQRSNLDLFKTATPHPVEVALELAKYASDENDLEEFKKQGAIILSFPEPQYELIIALYDLLIPYIKERTRISGILHEDANHDEEEALAEHVERMKIILEGAMFLEKYRDSFKQDISPEIDFLVTLHHDLFNSYYKNMTRGHEIAQIYEAVRGSQNG